MTWPYSAPGPCMGGSWRKQVHIPCRHPGVGFVTWEQTVTEQMLLKFLELGFSAEVVERRQGQLWVRVIGRLCHQHVFELLKPEPGIVRTRIAVKELVGKPLSNQY